MRLLNISKIKISNEREGFRHDSRYPEGFDHDSEDTVNCYDGTVSEGTVILNELEMLEL